MAQFKVLVVGRTNQFNPRSAALRGITQGFLSMDMSAAMRQLEEAAETQDTVVMFDGGEDVSPALYGQPNRHAQTDLSRDVREVFLYSLVRVLQIPVFAICRGHQLVAVLEGGSLYQDIRQDTGIKHVGPTHTVVIADDRFDGLFRSHPLGHYVVTSTHHQSVATTPPTGSIVATDITGQICESIVYPEFGMTVQSHPEYHDHFAHLQWVADNFLPR